MIESWLHIEPLVWTVVLTLIEATIITRIVSAAFGLTPPIDIRWPWMGLKSIFGHQEAVGAPASTEPADFRLDGCECHCPCCRTCRVGLPNHDDTPDDPNASPETNP